MLCIFDTFRVHSDIAVASLSGTRGFESNVQRRRASTFLEWEGAANLGG